MPRSKHDRPVDRTPSNQGAARKSGAAVRAAAWRSVSAVFEISMAFLPVWLLLRRHGMPDSVLPSWAVAAVIASVFTAALSEQLRSWWMNLVVSLTLSALAVWLIGPTESSFVGAGMLIVACLQGSTVHLRSRRNLWPWTGVAVYFAVSAIAQFRAEWSGATGLLAALGILHLAVALYLAHDRNIRDITLSEHASQRVPQEMKRQIRIYAAVLLLAMLALAAGLGGFIVHTLQSAAKGLISWLLSLFRSGPSEEILEEPPAPIKPEMPPMEPTEPSLLSHILNLVFYGIAIALFLAIAYWALSRLYRNRRDLWDKWTALLRRMLRVRPRTAPDATGYVDEETSLFSWEETLNRMRKHPLGRLFVRHTEPGYDELPDNRAKARFLYRRWLRGLAGMGYKVQPNLTPKELLADTETWQREHQGQISKRKYADAAQQDGKALVEIYYEARYRDREPTEEQLNRLRGKS